MAVYGLDLAYDDFHKSAHKHYALRSVKVSQDVSRKRMMSPVRIQMHGTVDRAGGLLFIRVSPHAAAFIRMVERDIMNVFDGLEERINPALTYTGLQPFYSVEGNTVVAAVSKHAQSFRVAVGERVNAQLVIKGVYHSSYSKGMLTEWSACDQMDQ